MTINVISNCVSLSSSFKNEIFKIVGTKQNIVIKIFLDSEDDDLTVLFKYQDKLVSTASKYSLSLWELNGYLAKSCSQKALESWYRGFLYQNKSNILEEMEEIKTNKLKELEKTNRLELLEKKYTKLLGNTWYPAHDLGFYFKVEDALSNSDIVGFKEVMGVTAYTQRHKWVLLHNVYGIILFDGESYWTDSPMGLKEPAQTVNWYGWGWNNGYGDNFCVTSETVRSESPVFPNPTCEETYWRGYEDGSYQGGMDT